MTEAESQMRAAEGLLDQLLAWVALRPRTYSETLEAWRTSCPRLPVWEDAVSGGLVRVQPGLRLPDRLVTLTHAGAVRFGDRTR